MVRLIITAFLALFLIVCSGQQNPSNSMKRNPTSACPIVQQIDSLMQLKIFEITEKQKSDLRKPATNENAGLPDMFYEYIFTQLNRETPIDLEFNEHVRKYITIFTIDRKDEIAKMIGLSKLYFPLFEQQLDQHQLPFELKYLAMVESALNPLAVSPSGAVGLWQFKMNTAELLQLNVTSYIDDRMNPFKSTEAACDYFDYLYRTFNDWTLVIAAYNGGPGEIRNAIERSGGKTDFGEIREYLPEQTKNYVPAFIAMNYVMANYQKHGIVPVLPDIFYYQTDTVQTSQPLTFQQISEVIGTPVDIIKFLNPMYRMEFIPESDQPATIILPSDKVVAFLEFENKIYANYKEQDDYNTLVAKAGSTENKIKIVHIVKKGEYFHKIAIKYNCSVENIKAWNGLTDQTIYPGQRLVIWVNKREYKKHISN